VNPSSSVNQPGPTTKLSGRIVPVTGLAHDGWVPDRAPAEPGPRRVHPPLIWRVMRRSLWRLGERGVP
jgi:hypothetical protein